MDSKESQPEKGKRQNALETKPLSKKSVRPSGMFEEGLRGYRTPTVSSTPYPLWNEMWTYLGSYTDEASNIADSSEIS